MRKVILRIRPAAAWLLLLAGPVLTFDSLLLQPGVRLSGNEGAAALPLWHVWWAQFGLQQSDGLIVNAYSGAPFLSNHLNYMPVVQSWVFGLAQLSGNPLLAFNLVLILSVTATELMMYRFLRSKGAPNLLSALGAIAFLLSPWYYRAVAGADIIVAGLWILPAALLAWDHWLSNPSLARAALVVAALFAAVLSGMQNVAWLVGLGLPYFIWTGRHFWRSHSDGAGREVRARVSDQLWAMGLLLAGLVFIYPVPNLMRTLQGHRPAFAPLVLVQPSEESLLSRFALAGPAVWAFGALRMAFGERSREADFWLIAGGASLLFGLGFVPDPMQMVLTVLGVGFLPLYDPGIFVGVALVALTAYAGIGWEVRWQEQLGERTRWLVAVSAVVVILLSNPAVLRQYQSHEVQAYPFYAEIAVEPEDYLLLDYPFGLQNTLDGQSLGSHADLAQYAVWHHKRTLSGIAPYYPDVVYQRFQQSTFLFPETVNEGNFESASEALAVAVREWRIGYVVGHTRLLSADELDAIDRLASQSNALCPASRRDGLVIYRARWHPYGCEDGQIQPLPALGVSPVQGAHP